MKKGIIFVSTLILLGTIIFIFGSTEEKTPPPEKNFYEKSLHYTNKGLEYWYGKEQGGLERLTGIPFSELPCAKCHVRTCDTCHKQEVNGKAEYSLEPARAQDICQSCHGIEPLEEVRKNPEGAALDVHFKKGMKCLDCHSVREVHGDGVEYNSIQQPGAMDTRCENCHSSLSQGESHTVHAGKVDCNACHIRDLPSCYNCHFDTRVKEGKSVSLPLKNLLFLINHEGKVTLGNLHTFVYQNKGMITFGPSFPHSIMKDGRKCEDCHHTQIQKDIKKNKFYPVVYEKGEIKNVKGVIPVLEGLKWNFVYLNYENGKWVPLENPGEPLLNYSGYSSPLTKEQFSKLEKAPAQKKPSPKK
jgi:hypothetical protein